MFSQQTGQKSQSSKDVGASVNSNPTTVKTTQEMDGNNLITIEVPSVNNISDGKGLSSATVVRHG